MSQVVPTGIDQLALMRLAWNDGQKIAALVRKRRSGVRLLAHFVAIPRSGQRQ
jgi:hypothetical protein